MKSIQLDGSPPVRIAVRRSTRTKKMSLRVSSLDGRVSMTVPPHLPISEARAFAEDRKDWILGALANAAPRVEIVEGTMLPIEGQLSKVVIDDRRKPLLENGNLFLPRRAPGRAAAALLKFLARDRLTQASDGHGAKLGRSFSALSLRDTRSRWGSCTETGKLMFSWRLIMAPPEILSYVAAHEVAHLERMDHSASFWNIVNGLDPDWRRHRRWLREHGIELHKFRFGD